MPPAIRANHRVTLALAAALFACGPRHADLPPPPPEPPDASPPPDAALPDAAPPPPQARRYVITLLSASIDGHRPDGKPWDEGGKRGRWSPRAGSPLASFAAQHPELDGAEEQLGEPVEVAGVADSAASSSAPDPLVLVEIGGVWFRSPMFAGQFQPSWRFPLTVMLMPGSEELVRLTVLDWDGPAEGDVLGEKVFSIRDLTAKRVHEPSRFGSVKEMIVEVVPADGPAAAGLLARGTRRLAVPGRVTWTDTGLTMVAGQSVTILATGEVCTKVGDARTCSGPEGQAKPNDYNVGGFGTRGHGALVGALGDTRFFVGRERRFRAPSSGPLLLGVNDRDSGNNAGAFEVSVTVD